jgi:hypothetical protein
MSVYEPPSEAEEIRNGMAPHFRARTTVVSRLPGQAHASSAGAGSGLFWNHPWSFIIECIGHSAGLHEGCGSPLVAESDSNGLQAPRSWAAVDIPQFPPKMLTRRYARLRHELTLRHYFDISASLRSLR